MVRLHHDLTRGGEERTETDPKSRAGEAWVIPVIIRPGNWKKAPFAKLQALPKDGKAVNLWPDRDAAWLDVSEGIERAIESIREKR
jgi:hypothetical protein